MPLAVQTLSAARKTLHCPCCHGAPERFLPIPSGYVEECRQRNVEHPLDAWETLNLESYLCPLCGATDRDRLQVLVLRSHLDAQRECSLPEQHVAIRVLEIAPSPPVSNWLKNRPEIIYRSADLCMSGADDRVDITDMAAYPGSSFDLVICSHVLEHIPDDLKAMREIRRILTPSGMAILLVPISTQIDDVQEDLGETDEAERWRRFGQGDHVRIYGRRGFVSRLEQSGFCVEWVPPGSADAAASGLTPRNGLYLARPN